MSEYREQAEKLANSMYKPHRFGDIPAWFSVSCDLAERVLELEAALRRWTLKWETLPDRDVDAFATDLITEARALLSEELQPAAPQEKP